MPRRQRLLARLVALLFVTAGLAGVGPSLVPLTPARSATAATVRNTGLAISPVFSQTLVGGFTQAGNTLLQCAAFTDGSPLPEPSEPDLPDGCVRDISTGLSLVTSNPDNLPFYNNQTIMQYLDRDSNPDTYASSSATVDVPAGAQVVYAELEWLGSSEADVNPDIQWNPSIYTEPMLMSVGDDQHYVSVPPDQGESIMPGAPDSDTNDFYYTASANVTQYLAGRTGQITVWGANAPFPANGFNQAGLGWNIVVVYQYPSANPAANPPQVAKQITLQTGFVYQQSGAPGTNTVVDVPEVTDPSHIEVGLIAGEGDVGIGGDTFAIDGTNIAHPVTGQTNNFFVSYAQGATDPNWTSNFSTDNVAWTLASGIVSAGATSVTLTTTTSGDGYFLQGLNTAIPVPDVCLDKSVDTNPYTTVDQTLTYTFTVTNCSGAPIDNITVSDPLFGGPIAACDHPGVLAEDDSYTCDATYVVTAADIAAGSIVNTATAAAFIPGTDTPVAPATATATTTTSTTLQITKVGSPKPVHVGDPFSYTITVTNTGDADAANVTVTDPLPAGLANPTVTSGNATITDGVLQGTDPLLPPGGTFTITVSGTIASGFTGTTITNTATVAAAGNTNCGAGSTDPGCSSTDQTDVLQPAPITITKSASDSAPQPGETFTYTVQVRNLSDTTTATVTVDDPIPANLTGASWICAASAGSACGTPNGTGDITGVHLTLLPLGDATFTITVTVDPAFQGGTITDTATATPGQYTVCENGAVTCDASVPVTSTPDPAPLSIDKELTSPATPPVAGQAITYTVTVTNDSPTTVAHGTFDDPVPAQIVADLGWTATPTSSATPSSAATGFPEGVTLVIPPGGTVTFTISAHVAATYNGANVTNVASVTPGTNTVCADGSTPACDAETSFVNPARLSVVKVRTPAVPAPGRTVVYRVIVTNNSGAVGSGDFTDPLPAELDAATATWVCTPSAGSTCGTATGTGSPGVPAPIPITVAAHGGTVTFLITATVLPSPVAVTVRNVASVTPTDDTACVNGHPTCDGVDTFTSRPPPATLNITKEHSPSPAPGGPVTYIVRVTNTSTTTQAQGTVNDPFDAPALTGITWTAAATSGSTVSPGNGSGAITGVQVTLAPSGVVTFTVHATVAATWPGGDVVNTSVVTPGTNTECDPSADPSCSGTANFPTPSLIAIVKTHEPTSPPPQLGEYFTYRVTVSNLSDQQAANLTFDDPLPPELDAAAATWSTVPQGAGTTVSPASGTGSPLGVAVVLAPEGSVTFVIRVRVLPTFEGGTITNTGFAAPGTNTACDPGPAVCAASTSFTPLIPPAPLAIRKSVRPVGPVAPGDTLTYTITVLHTGTTTIARGTITDAIPAGVLPGTWTATATAGSTVTPTAGSGPITAQVTVTPGGRVTFTRVTRVDPNFRSDFNIDNVATAHPGANTHCDPTDPRQACDTNAVVHVNVRTVPVTG